MKLTAFDLMRVWAAITGLALAACYFLMLWNGVKVSDMLPNLIAGIGGFEMFLTVRDMWDRRRGLNG